MLLQILIRGPSMKTMVVCLCLLTTVGHAQDGSGNAALEGCREYIKQGTRSPTGQGYCVGVIQTLHAFPPSDNPNYRYCIPDAVEVTQMIRVVVVHMERQPQNLHFPFPYLAAEAFAKAWPCPK
jgi:hypothetical protein